EIPRDNDPHFGVAVIERSGERRIVVHNPHDVEVRAGLEALQEILALLAAVAVVHVNGQALEIEIDAVTKQQHQNRRHNHHNDQTARVAEDLDDFFSSHGQEASEAHAVRSFPESRAVVSETKTSSRLGCIFSILPTVML